MARGRSRSSARSDFAGIHVFRYSARPGTPAIRMAGQVDERDEEAARGRAACGRRRARGHAGRAAHVGARPTSCSRRVLDDGRWVGHAADHTLVAAPPPVGGAASLENVIGRVGIDAVDPVRRDRVVGRILSLLAATGTASLPGCPRSMRPDQPDCLFCRIVRGELPSDRVAEDDLVLAFRDIAPRSPTHVLVIPKDHIASAADLTEEDGPLLGRLFATAARIARDEGIADAAIGSSATSAAGAARPSTISTST